MAASKRSPEEMRLGISLAASAQMKRALSARPLRFAFCFASAMAGATISNGKHRIEMEIEHEYEHEAESLYSKTVSDKNILYKER